MAEPIEFQKLCNGGWFRPVRIDPDEIGAVLSDVLIPTICHLLRSGPKRNIPVTVQGTFEDVMARVNAARTPGNPLVVRPEKEEETES